MAYRAKYRYRWTSQNGNQGEVLLLKDSYTGAVIDRPLGRAPELSMEQNGHIHGTSLVLYLECREDGEYTELYTSSAKEWQVQLWWNGRSLWTGYLTPELYSEPDIAPPYDVCVTATDSLGELKRSEYKPASWDLSLEDHLYGILALTGLDQTIYHTGGLSADGRPGASMLHEVKVDLSHLQGKTCYDVLDGILTAINAELTSWGQQWMLLRPSDLDSLSANLALYPANGGGSQTWSIPSYGSARTHGRWPVGQMSTQIIASRSAVTVQSPNHLREGSELSPDGWSGSGSTAIRVEAGATSASGELITEGHWELMAGGSISQSVKYSKGLGAHTLRIDQYGISKVHITYTTSPGSAVHKLGMANGQVGWDMGGDILIGSKTRETLEIPIPAWAGAGTLTVSIALANNIVSPVTVVYGVSFAVNAVPYGLELRLDLSNGARSEADVVESSFSTYPGGEESYDVLLSQSGLPSFGGSPVSRWSTTKLGSQSYIGLLAMDIALGCALPRARKTGKLNVPQGADPTFLLLSDGSRNYFVSTYTVDLLEDEVSVDMVSLPAAELEVAEETYSAMTGGSSASYGSGSPGGQALPGYTVLSYDEAVALSEDPGSRTIPSAWALKTHISDGVKHITSAERTKWNKVVSDFAAITGNDSDAVINKWEEVVAFLDTYTEADTLANLLSNKVDKVSGKGLSTNDFTDALLTKLNGIEAGANKYIHPTHSAVTIASADGRVLGNISVDTLGHVTSVGYKALGFADIPSLYIGKTKVQSSSAAQVLTGISSITLEGSTAELKWDDDKSAWRLSGNLLVDGFVASGGTGSSGGSSGGAVDVSYVANLTAGTLLGTLTINGTDYQILAPSLTASSINAALGNTPVARATADAEGNSISGTYAKTSSLPTKVSQLTNDSGYLTGITKAMVEGVLTGNITSHTHSQYLTAHQSVTLASGTNNGTLKLTVGGTVTDNIAVKGLGTAAYTDSSAYAPASHTHTFASLTEKPITISGYGITDAYTKTETDTKLRGYLPLTGGVMTGTLASNGGYYISNPEGGRYTTLEARVTGCLTITLPVGVRSTMVSMWIDVYNYVTQSSFSVHLGGYTYLSGNTWVNNPFAMVYGAQHRVRLGYDGTHFVIYIGETTSGWEYPQVSVRDVALGFSGDTSAWRNAWSIGFSTEVQNVTYDTTTYVYTTKNLTASVIGGLGALSNNISGNAATATNATNAALADYANGLKNKGVLNSQEEIDGFITAGKFEYATLKTSDSNNINFDGNDGMILSIPWSSTYYGAQMAFDDTLYGTVKVRSKSYSWGAWYTLLHSGNYNSYSPKLDGTGATGNWGIDISGNAATATDADTLDGFHESDFSRHVAGMVSSTGTTYYKLGTLPASNPSTWDAFLIQGEIGGISSSDKAVLNVCVGRRNGVTFSGYTQGLWQGNLGVDIGVNDAGEIALIVNRSYASWTLDLHTIQGEISYTGTTFTPADTNFVLLSASNKVSKSLASGAVEKATKLATARTIWGQSFDGTGNVSGALTGVTDLTASGKIQGNTLTLNGTNLLEWDESNSAWKFSGNLIATGFIASGDISAQAAALAEEEDRIAALEAQVAELQAEIENLKAQ